MIWNNWNHFNEFTYFFSDHLYCKTSDVPTGVINNKNVAQPKSPVFGEATHDEASETETEDPAIEYAIEEDQMTQAVFIKATNHEESETEIKKEHVRTKDPLAVYRTQQAPFNYVWDQNSRVWTIDKKVATMPESLVFVDEIKTEIMRKAPTLTDTLEEVRMEQDPLNYSLEPDPLDLTPVKEEIIEWIYNGYKNGR